VAVRLVSDHLVVPQPSEIVEHTKTVAQKQRRITKAPCERRRSKRGRIIAEDGLRKNVHFRPADGWWPMDVSGVM
jgi:hypothetical protein